MMQRNAGGTFSLRSLERLDSQIRSTRSTAERSILFAKRAGYLAKIASIEEAKTTVAQLRIGNSNYDPQLSAWIMFAEGQILHFETLDNRRTKDKFHRAFLVAQMANDRELAGNTAAWLALCELTAGQVKDAAEHLKRAFEWSDPDCCDARGRAAMVLADGLNWAGQRVAAKRWYKEARRHAVQDGDIAMQNVMLYNSSAFSVAHLTLADCRGAKDPAEQNITAMEVSSASNLNFALGIDHLKSLIPIMQAELFAAQEKWTEAQKLFDENIEVLVQDGQQRLLPKILAQRAWCKANTGEIIGAEDDIGAAIAMRDDCADLDDLAVMHFRIASALKLLGKSADSSTHRTIAEDCIRLFEQQQADIQVQLMDVVDSVVTKDKDPAFAGSQGE